MCVSGAWSGSEAVLVASEWQSVAGADEWGVLRDAAAVAVALDRRGRHESALLSALVSSFELPADVATTPAGEGSAAGPLDSSREAVAEQDPAGAAAVGVLEEAVKKQRPGKPPLQDKQPDVEGRQPAGKGTAAGKLAKAGQQGGGAAKGLIKTAQQAAVAKKKTTGKAMAKVAPAGQASCRVAPPVAG